MAMISIAAHASRRALRALLSMRSERCWSAGGQARRDRAAGLGTVPWGLTWPCGSPTPPYLPFSAQNEGRVMDRLKLIALDKEDIQVVSAHLQDAVVKAADIRWRPAEKRLVIALNRFDWEAAHGTVPEFRRRPAPLRFDRLSASKRLNCSALEACQA